ncbi:F-box domain [Macleaya cordata]|uniref:F-box domain n=1 Tax=Macleaya cordata TaxID=56857 RepID=A0A200QFI5_MACCD|nr:F-box domain [Macleaya cordata]
MGVGKDRISELSDPILHHILCFLPSKCAVRTSILSKRWRYLYPFIPILDFRNWRSIKNNCDLEANRFRNFVDRILNLPDMPNIQKFCLDVDVTGPLDSSWIHAWIDTVIRRKVEELILIIDMDDEIYFPPCFFTCQTLTILDLEIISTIELPESIYFPKLKILRLKYFVFADENMTQKFFSNCPVLEELTLTRCSWLDMEVLCISAPALKRLFITGPSVDGCDGLDDCKLNIYAPSLLSLRYHEGISKDYSLHSFPSLLDADIDFIVDAVPDITGIVGRRAIKLLEKLTNVKLLKMSGDTFEGFEEYLNNSGGWKLNLVPQFLLLHLKSVEFKEFYGHRRELLVVKLFLKNAPVLQWMTITSSSFMSENLKNKMEVYDQLLLFPRGSTSCVVKFS